MKLSDIQEISHHFSYTESASSQAQVQEQLRALGYDPDNFYQELEMSSPLVDTHRDISYANAQLHLHSHTFYELLFCRTSCGAEYLIGSDRYRLQRGDIIFVTPGVSHRPLLPENMSEPYKRYVLWLSPEFVDGFIATFAPEGKQNIYSTLLRTSGTQWEVLGEYFRRGVEETEARKPGWQAAVIGNTITLLTLMSRGIQERTAAVLKAEQPDLLDRVLAYVEENLSGKITLADTAKAFYVSESTICQMFRQKLDASFYRCVTQRRLIAAKTLIEKGLLLEEVSSRTGFSDYSSFYRAFRQEYGISPRQYRKITEAPEQLLP